MKKIYLAFAFLVFYSVAFAQVPAEKMILDTINTADKFIKIILYDDYTWEYLNTGKPVINDSDFYEYWDTSCLHAYKSVPLSSLPDEIDLKLIDSVHHYCAPIVGRVYSGYKFRKTREHTGIDIPLNRGDTIRAAFDGVVRIADYSRNTGGYGNLVIIRHPNGLETYYGHLSSHIVKSGEMVKAGEIIGFGGSTGRSSGPHLHFEARYKGQTFDPERLIDFSTGMLRDSLITLKKHYFSIYSHYGLDDNESEEAAGRITHRIKSGETLGKIASTYGTTVSRICKLNNISPKKVLRIGEMVVVR